MSESIVKEVFEKLEKRSSAQAIDALLNVCEERFAKGEGVSANFLYFANAQMRHLFDVGNRDAMDSAYWRALMESDVLFPDGIALSLSYCRFSRPETNPLSMLFSYREMGDATLPNLNGTDLLPELLIRFRERFGSEARGFFYGTREETVAKAASAMSEKSGMPIGFRNGFEEFDAESFLSDSKGPKILFVGLGTPKQEIWSRSHVSEFGPTLVVTVGGFFDFMGGGEKRAPQWVRKFRLEWLWRVLLNPKKNGKKVLTSLAFFPRFFRGFRSS